MAVGVSEELSRLYVRIMGDADHYIRTLTTTHQRTQSWAANIGRAVFGGAETMSTGLSRMALQAVGALGPVMSMISGIGGAIRGVQLAAEMEQLTVSFEVMMGSAEKAQEMVKRLTDFANRTPLQLGDTMKAAKQLLQAGIGGNQMIDTLRMLGDAAAGDANNFQRLVYVFAETARKGRLMGDDIRQYVSAGFNLWEGLEKVTGKNRTELMQMEHQGRITFDMVVAGLRAATGEGGRMHNMMERQSKTLSGLWSTAKDGVDGFLRSIGQAVVVHANLKGVVDKFTKSMEAATQWFDRQAPAVKRLVVQAALWLTAIGLVTFAWPLLSRVALDALNTITYPLRLVINVLRLLHVQQIINMGIWIAWKAVVLTASLAVFVFNTALSVAGVAISGLAAGLVAAVATAGLLAVGFIVVAAAGLAVWRTVKDLWDLFAESPVVIGAVTRIGAVLKEWWQTIQLVVKAAKVDLGLAWQIAQAGFELAVAQVKNLWPPLWEFMKEGFGLVVTYSAAKFKEEFSKAFTEITTELGDRFWEWFSKPRQAQVGVEGVFGDQARKFQEKAQEAGEKTSKSLKDLLGKGFELPPDDKATQDARDRLKVLEGDLNKALVAPVAKDRAIDLGNGINNNLTQPLKNAHKAAKDLDLVLFGSSAFFARAAHMQDIFSGREGAGFGGAGLTGTRASDAAKGIEAVKAGGPEAGAKADKMLDIAKQQLGALKTLVSKPGLEVQPAGL